jgi:hypothetical protein
MRYIDKSKQKQEGDALVDDYLDTCCKISDPQLGTRYINVDFDGFRKVVGKKFINLLLANQSRYCCYCMRKLNSKEQVSLEHIIPQHVRDEKLAFYRSAPNLSDKEVILNNHYVAASDQRRPPYPHIVAYNNLVASCDGVFADGTQQMSCNHRRGNREVLPLYYWPEVVDWIQYTPNGQAISVAIGDKGRSMEQLIDVVGLNCNMLTNIRRLWYLLRTKKLADICQCIHDEHKRMNLLYQILFKDVENVKRDLDILNKFSKQNYWEKLMRYTYFYDYYQGC